MSGQGEVRSLASDTFSLFVSTILTGVVSYAVFFVASRTLTADAASTFVTLWAIANTLLLALTIPSDTFSPRLRLECERAGVTESDRLFLLSAYAILVGVLIAVVPFVIWAVGLLDVDLAGAASISVFGLASTFFASRRAFLTANGEFRRFMMQSAVFAVVGLVALCGVWILDAHHQVWIYLALTIANLLAALAALAARSDPPPRSHAGIQQYVPFLRRIRAAHTLSNLVLVTLIAVALSNGSLMFAKVLGIASADIVAYAASVNIVLVPYTVLNSFTSPIHNRFVASIARGDRDEVWSAFWKAGLRYSAATVVLSVASLPLLGRLIELYAGAQYHLSGWACLGVAVGEGLATMSGLPRTLLVALGETRRVTPTWLAGLVLFGATLLVPVDPLARLVLAPGVAAAGILLLSVIQIHTVLWRRHSTNLGSLDTL